MRKRGGHNSSDSAIPDPRLLGGTRAFDLADVSSHWTGGRNVTWRLTHEPTGIVVEGTTEIPEDRFTKKRLRIAEEKLRAELIEELERRVARKAKAVGE
jgi:hypothetical protein